MKTMRYVLNGFSILAVCAVLFPSSSSAATIVHTASLPLDVTNWNSSVTIPQFALDPLCLQSVRVELAGHVEGVAKFESLDGAPATVEMNLQAMITLQRPDTTPLVTVTPLVNSSGGGNIVLPAVALGTSNGSGAGNLLLQFNTYASVDVTVTYTYDCTIAADQATWSEIKGLYR